MDSDRNWLTVREIASELQVHEETVRRWIRGGELSALELGGPRTMYRVRRSDLLAFMRNREPTGGEKPASVPIRELPENFRQVVESLPIVTFVFYPARSEGRGSLLYINPNVEEIFGVPAEDWYRDLDSVWPRLMSRDEFERTSRRSAQLRAATDEFSLDLEMKNAKTGKPVWVSVKMEVDRPAAGQELWYGLMIDITDRKLAEERLHFYVRTLNRLASRMIDAKTLDRVVYEIFRSVPTALPVFLARLHLVDLDGKHPMTYSMRLNAGRRSDLDAIDVEETDLLQGQLVSRAMRSGRTVSVPDLSEARGMAGDDEAFEKEARSAVAVPIQGQDRILAVLEAFSRDSDAFPAAGRTFLEGVASIAALAFSRQSERWFTVQDVSDMLGVRPETVRRWIRNGELTATLPGGVRAGYRIDSAEIDQFIEKRQSAG